MERGPVALFSAIVAVGLGPALWLGVQFGSVGVEPYRPPVVSEVDPGGQELLGGRGAGATTDNSTVVKTQPRANVRSITSSPTPSPSTSPSPSDPGPSASPSESADPGDDPTTPVDPTDDPTDPGGNESDDPTIPPEPPEGDDPSGEPSAPADDGGSLGTGERASV
jgi:hypothetical protein